MTFIAACREFFGMKQQETLMEFMAEIKALTPQDREDLKAMMLTVGIDASKTS
jgi:hypothetical protein